MKYKSTIIIYSEFDPQQMELSVLVYEAEQGSAICDSMQATLIPDTELPEGVREFFQLGEQWERDINKTDDEVAKDFESSPDPDWMNP